MTEHSKVSPEKLSPVVVTGANGLVGSHLVAALRERGVAVRAVVRRAGTAPTGDGVEEHVGDFTDPEVAAAIVEGAAAVVTTVHPMGGDRETQHRVAVEGTPALARAAAAAGVQRFVHLSTAGVYDRSPGVGDVDEHARLVGDDTHDYAVTKRQTDDALGSDELAGLTRVLVRPPAVLGPSETSAWNVQRPEEIRQDLEGARRNPDGTFAWIHVTDLAALLAMVATGEVAPSDDPESGPVIGACTPVNAAAPPAPWRAYYETVGRALGRPITWVDDPAWTGAILTDRAQRWGWSPAVGLDAALGELEQGILARAGSGEARP